MRSECVSPYQGGRQAAETLVFPGQVHPYETVCLWLPATSVATCAVSKAQHSQHSGSSPQVPHIHLVVGLHDVSEVAAAHQGRVTVVGWSWEGRVSY